MLLATWNVNGIRARSQRLAEWLAERQPDVVCLQELKIVETEFPHLELRASGYHAVLSGQQSWNGVAVIAKERPELVMRELPGAEEAGARFVVAKVHGMEVASVYIPNGKTKAHPDFKMKLAWLESLALHVEARAKSGSDVPLLVGRRLQRVPDGSRLVRRRALPGPYLPYGRRASAGRAAPWRGARRPLSREVSRQHRLLVVGLPCRLVPQERGHASRHAVRDARRSRIA